MLMERTITAVDLFCGGGGTSSGLMSASQALDKKIDLLGINHWNVALETYAKNFPYLRDPVKEDIYTLSPFKYFPGGYLDLMMASPECIYHSNARGDGPCNEQSRSGAKRIIDWLSTIHVDKVLIKNVKEFINWGPLDEKGQPIKALKGIEFQAFLSSLNKLGYTYDWRILNCADYGDTTTRKRFFLMAKKEKPEPLNGLSPPIAFTKTTCLQRPNPGNPHHPLLTNLSRAKAFLTDKNPWCRIPCIALNTA